jgi:uncharacterized small protein (DUF1192 family)
MQAEARRSQKGPRWRNTVLIMTICLAFGRRVSGYVNGFVPVCFSREVAASSSILSEVPRFRRVISRKAKMYSLSMSASASSDSNCDASSNNLEQRIALKGDEIRKLKAEGISKIALKSHVEELLALKEQLAPSREVVDEDTVKEGGQKQGNTKKANSVSTADLSESQIRQVRLSKASALQDAGLNPYAYSYNPTHTAAELQSIYEGKLNGGEEDENADVAVAGRIMARRVFGKIAFFTLLDESGTIQLHMDKKRLGSTFKVSGSDGKRNLDILLEGLIE